MPPALARWLVAHGHVADHVTDVGLLNAADIAIAARAEQDGSILVSKDEDFVLLRFPNRFSLLWLRVGNATNRALIEWLDPRWPAIARLLTAGERLVEVR